MLCRPVREVHARRYRALAPAHRRGRIAARLRRWAVSQPAARARRPIPARLARGHWPRSVTHWRTAVMAARQCVADARWRRERAASGRLAGSRSRITPGNGRHAGSQSLRRPLTAVREVLVALVSRDGPQPGLAGPAAARVVAGTRHDGHDIPDAAIPA